LGRGLLRDRRLRGGLGRFRFLGLAWLGPVREHARHGEAPDLRNLFGPAQPLERVDGRLRHVDRIRGAEALREDVADSGELEHGSHSAAGDHTGSLARGSEEHPGRPELAQRLVRDRRSVLWHGEEVLLRVVDGLRDRERDLARLAVADADAVDLVADYDERRERETPSTLHHLGDAVDLDHPLLELPRLLAREHLAFDTRQNLNPPSRAPSASALTRP